MLSWRAMLIYIQAMLVYLVGPLKLSRRCLVVLVFTISVVAGMGQTFKSSIFASTTPDDRQEKKSGACIANRLVQKETFIKKSNEMITENALMQARNLVAPVAKATLNGEYEGYDFWNEHHDLLKTAWKEWEKGPLQEHLALRASSFVDFDPGNATESIIMDNLLLERVRQMRLRPTSKNEMILKELWTEVHPGVFRGMLLNPDGIRYIRSILDAVQNESKIPRRRPNGMNRFGIIINDVNKYKDEEDCRTVEVPGVTPGGVSLDSLSKVVHRIIVDRFVRPLGRMLFPDRIGREDDEEAYAFTIRYSSKEDMELKEHNDASVVTLNVNLNLPEDETFEGSCVSFVHQESNAGPSEPSTTHVSFDQPGMALIHLGQVRHSAQPITRGERQNLVIWLFGSGGYVRIAPYDKSDQTDSEKMFLTAKDRWEGL